MINKVVINWEAAYGKAYYILVSVYSKIDSQAESANWKVHKKFTKKLALTS